MKLIGASWLITCDENNTIIKDGGVVFDEKIIEIGQYESLKEKYKDIETTKLQENSVLMPGLINSHVHLEFSANSTTLKYGNFMEWLNSVILNRDTLIEKASKKLISTKLDRMKKCGTTTIGAISSYSFDLSSCVDSPLNTIFFCEVIGSKADMVDTLFSDFKARIQGAKKFESKNFKTAVAIHSPYSVHPFLVRESLKLAKEQNLAVSSHFLESPEEFEWLHRDEGLFVEFFKKFLNQERAVAKPMEFLNLFKGVENLSFTHCVEASDEDLAKIKELGAVINHCATSNRVLNNSRLELSKLDGINYSIGTDGLSSNNSLSMFDELRNALMIHQEQNLNSFSNELLVAATKGGAKALGLNKGVLSSGFDADIISIELPDCVKESKDLATHVILHTKFVKNSIIGGEYV